MNKAILSSFVSHYGDDPEHFIFAPGRANIIGEHTDYNNGFVMPFAIKQGIWFYGSSNSSNIISIIGFDKDQSAEINLDTLESTAAFEWLKFFIQALKIMRHYKIKGINIIFGGNLPIGAGISSSSALTCGFIALVDKIYNLNLNNTELLHTAITAERGYGVKGGIMDQFTILNARRNEAILLDCKTNLSENIPLNLGDYKFYLFNTNVQHNLVHTDYNNRNIECSNAVSLISEHYKVIESLRDIGWEDLNAIQPILGDTLFNRVSFVVQENRRVIKAKEKILHNDFPSLGALLYESHDGLSQMYQVSCQELDWLVNYTMDCDQVVGARMMGGGFGGCTINLVYGRLSAEIERDVKEKYKTMFGILPEIFEVSPSDGIIALR